MEVFGSIQLSKVLIVATALLFAYKTLKEGYAILITFLEKKQAIVRNDKCVDEMKDQIDAIRAGVLALLHFRLYAECERVIEAGYCSVEEWEDIEHLYASYTPLGGNGTGTIIYKTARDIFMKPTKKKETK